MKALVRFHRVFWGVWLMGLASLFLWFHPEYGEAVLQLGHQNTWLFFLIPWVLIGGLWGILGQRECPFFWGILLLWGLPLWGWAWTGQADMVFLVWNWTKLFVVTGIFLIWLWGVGDRMFPRQNPLNALAWGIVITSAITVFLARSDFFSREIVGALFLFGVVSIRSEFWQQVGRSLQKKYTISLWQGFFLSGVLVFWAVAIVQSTFPFTLGWDGSNTYLLALKTLVTSGGLPAGIWPPFYESLLAVPSLWGGISVTSVLTNAMGLLLLGALWKSAQALGFRGYWAAIVSGACWMLPVVGFLLVRESKPDIWMLFLAVVSFATLLQKRYFSAVFLAGVATCFKITAGGIFPLIILWGALYTGKFWPQRLLKMFQGSVIFLLPLLLWGFFGGGGGAAFLAGDFWLWLKGFSLAPNLREVVFLTPPTGFSEEISRYGETLWHMFTQVHLPKGSRFYTDIGFLWVGILPAVGFLFLRPWNYSKTFFAGGLCFLTGWFLWGHGVGWYALPGVFLLMLSGARILFEQASSRPVLWGGLIFTIFLGIAAQWYQFSPAAVETSARWLSAPTEQTLGEVAEDWFSEERHGAQILSQDDRFVYRIGTMMPFWIEDFFVRVFDDPQLDFFQAMNTQFTPQEMLTYLEDQGFGWVVFDRGTVSIEADPEGTLHQKVAEFERWASEYLVVRFRGDRLVLFQVSPISSGSPDKGEK